MSPNKRIGSLHKTLTSKYQLALGMLAALRRRLYIVVVGANDGRVNDPIYGFVMARSSTTKILLIEPNEQLLPHLDFNYRDHPDYSIAHCAIGNEGMLLLYVISEEYWERFQPAYAAGWPVYRAATGLTSATKANIEHALRREGLNPDTAIKEIRVRARALDNLLVEIEWECPIDVIQVDTEGYDDIVIYNSSIAQLKPRVVHYERLTDATRESELRDFLTDRGYTIFPVWGDVLAIRKELELASVLLHVAMFIHTAFITPFKLLCRPFKRHWTTAS